MSVIKTPHLVIKKLVVDPEHTKPVIRYFVDQILRGVQQENGFRCYVIADISGTQYITRQKTNLDGEELAEEVWRLYFDRSKGIIKNSVGIRDDTFGNNPRNAQIAITIDDRNYDFDTAKEDMREPLYTRICEADRFLVMARDLRERGVLDKSDLGITDVECNEYFQNYDLPMQLYLIDHVYQRVQMKLGQNRIKKLREKMKNMTF